MRSGLQMRIRYDIILTKPQFTTCIIYLVSCEAAVQV